MGRGSGEVGSDYGDRRQFGIGRNEDIVGGWGGRLRIAALGNAVQGCKCQTFVAGFLSGEMLLLLSALRCLHMGQRMRDPGLLGERQQECE